MAYNYALKSYKNGTYQLIYYSTPILESYDRQAIKDLNYMRMKDQQEIIYDDADNYTPWGYQDFDLEEEEKQIIATALSDEDLIRKKEHSISTSKARTINKICDYGRDNMWDWFLTFTLNEEVVKDRKNYEECTKKVRKWLDNVKQRKCPNMKYLLIPELHPSSGAYHFHALVSNVEELTFDIAINNLEFRKDKDGNIMTDKNGQPVPNKYFGEYLRTDYPNGDYIYNIRDFKNGWSTATRIKDTKKTVSYVVKYITKELVDSTFGKRRYFISKGLTLPTKEFALQSCGDLATIIADIEYQFGVKMSNEVVKTVEIKSENYKNNVTYLEFQ